MLSLLWALFISFGKVGVSALGGGHSMLKLIEYEAVISRHWLAKSDYISMLGTTFLFPGLTAVKLSALIGYQVGGVGGLMVSVLALNLPGLCFSLMGYQLLTHWHSPIADKLIIIVQYGALALLAAASFSIANSVIKQHFSPLLFLLTVFFFILLALFDLPPFMGLLSFIGLGFLLTSVF